MLNAPSRREGMEGLEACLGRYYTHAVRAELREARPPSSVWSDHHASNHDLPTAADLLEAIEREPAVKVLLEAMYATDIACRKVQPTSHA